MPADTTSQAALVVIAVAVAVQTVVITVVAIAAATAWKRMQADVDERYRALVMRVDETLHPIRQAAEAVQQVSNRTADAFDRAGHAAGMMKSMITMPRNVAMLGAMSLAGAVLRRWRGVQLRGELGESMGSLRDSAARRVSDLAGRTGHELNELSATVGKVKGAVTAGAQRMAEGMTEQARPDGRSRM